MLLGRSTVKIVGEQYNHVVGIIIRARGSGRRTCPGVTVNTGAQNPNITPAELRIVF